MCDRVYIMNEGKMAGELDAKGSNPGRHHGTYHAESEEIMKGENTMNSKIKDFLRKYTMVIALVIVFILFCALTDGRLSLHRTCQTLCSRTDTSWFCMWYVALYLNWW